MIEVHETKGDHAVMRSMQRFAEITGRSVFQEIQTTARSLCVALARGTLPVGLGKDVHEKQKKRIAKDISKTLLSDSAIYQEIDVRQSALAGEFWRAVKIKDEPKALEIMRRAGVNYPHAAQPAPHTHWGRQKIYITDSKSKDAYIRGVQKQAGKAKAGWAMAADEAAGHHRGIPLWASARKHPDADGGAIVRNNPRNPEITIMNHVSYIEDAMRGTSVWRTVQIAYEKLHKRIRIITEKTAANFKSAA
jgi:hypothetical protein